MIEKIQISLWDLFTFFLSGFLLFAFVVGHLVIFSNLSMQGIWNALLQVPASVSLFVFPMGFLLFGILLEPLANYFDRLVNYFWLKVFPEDELQREQESLVSIIKEKHLPSFGIVTDNPYHFCKDFVEAQKVSSTYMVFMSRFGFYRNVAFLSFVSAIVDLFFISNILAAISISFLWLFLWAIYRKRSADFYGYLAPSIYRNFIIAMSISDKDETRA